MKPIKIYGSWDEGIVLDNHMLKSVFIGYDNNQKEVFENTRTEIGELVYQYKYHKKKECLNDIMKLIKGVLDTWCVKEKIDIVIPVPPSKKKREYQPVVEIAKEISKYLNKNCKLGILYKTNNIQAKDGHSIEGSIISMCKNEKLGNVLIVDDLFSTGATLNEVCKVLRRNNNVNKIYCLVLTKTKG